MPRSRSQRLSREEWAERVRSICEAARDAARDLSQSFEALKNAEQAYRNGTPVVPAVLGSSPEVGRLVRQHQREIRDRVSRARAWMDQATATARQAIGQLEQLVEELHSIVSELHRRYESGREHFSATFRHERIATITRSMLDEEGDLFTRWLAEAESCWREIDQRVHRISDQASQLARSLGDSPGKPSGVGKTVQNGLARIPRAGTESRIPNVDPWKVGNWHQGMSPPSDPKTEYGSGRRMQGEKGSWWSARNGSSGRTDRKVSPEKGADDDAS